MTLTNVIDIAKKVTKGAGIAGAILITAVGGGIVYSFLGIDHDVKLAPAIEAERQQFESPQAGRLSYYVDRSGTGRPLILIHSINAAASAFEVKPLFDHYRGQRPIYALDLPGFGFSDRSQRQYAPQLYMDAITDFLTMEVGAEADVVALSLASEFAAGSALAEPELVRSLALISPSGLGATFEPPGDGVYQFFSFPLWRQPFFDLLASRASIRYFLSRNFVGDVPEALVDYSYASSHQPGAPNAPLYFVSGQLFTPDIRTAVYEKLSVPTLVIYDRDPNLSFAKLPDLLASNQKWQTAQVKPSLGLPHWELLPDTVAALEEFWQDLP